MASWGGMAVRSIPACAGEPKNARFSRHFAKVYPRVCGGTRAQAAWSGTSRGLSPRVRGNRSPAAPGGGPPGSIPACAGEPHPGGEPSPGLTVYPRVCGGTQAPPAGRDPRAGLSPRVRGNRFHRLSSSEMLRSIPACAGEPAAIVVLASSDKVYPRVCGGTHQLRLRPGAQPGLSPRVRGNRQRRAEAHRLHRSIPACAGEPVLSSLEQRTVRVYPRVCGGTNTSPGHRCFLAGLSPRVRGNQSSHENRDGMTGSIPACAGEPGTGRAVGQAHPVYPRVCGGTQGGAVILHIVIGLSPRVRGNRYDCRL